MTLRELYEMADGNYEQAIATLRVEKLMDKHIRKLPSNEIFSRLFAAGKEMDAAGIFESTHAIKGVCGNLGLTKLAAMASELSEEFRPGNPRNMTDDTVRNKLSELEAQYQKTLQAIEQYNAQS